MRISKHVYKLTGIEYGINSSIYGIDTQEGIVLLDAGYQNNQWLRMKKTLEEEGLADKKITTLFLTHCHFDHAGNVHTANEEGIHVVCAEPDASRIENGNPESEELFHTKWICGKVDERPVDGQKWHFGDITVEALSAPGHTSGSYAYIIYDGDKKLLFAGDMFFVGPLSPDDGVSVELAYMGSIDFTLEGFVNTLKRVSQLHCDVLLTGHYYPYFGDVDEVARRAYEEALALLKKKEEA